MNLEFLFHSYNLFFTFTLVIALINMLNKILSIIIRVLTTPETNDSIKTNDEIIDAKLDKADIDRFTSVSVDFNNVRKIPMIQYFINMNSVSPMFFINLILFSFGIGGLLISFALYTNGYDLGLMNFIISFASSAFIALTFSKLITYVYSRLFPTFNTILYPRENLVGLPGWVISRKQNLYMCQVIEPCGQSFKVNVSLPTKDVTLKYRATIKLTKYNEKDDCFEGKYIEKEEASKIFNKLEKKAYSAIRQELVNS